MRRVVQQRGGECRRIGKTHEHGKPVQLLRRLRQRVRLPVGDHLQPVLDPAQEAVGEGQFRGGAAGQVAGPHQQAQRVQRARIAQPRIAAAPNQLQGLRQELDFANAALAELHVVPGDPLHLVGVRGDAGALVGVDPPLHGVDVRHRREIQVPPPDERPDRLQELGAERKVTGHRTRLQHGGAFPVLAHALVVGNRGEDRDRGRRRRRIRAQPQIGAEHVAVGVAGLHQPDKSA